MRNAIVIPARFNSTRLPEKVLLDLGGKPIVQHVYERCVRVKNVDEVWIAVDNEKVMEACKEFTDMVMMTSDEHESGTDRIAEVANKLSCDNVINVQGDEPFIEVSLLESLVELLVNSKAAEIVTAATPIFNEEAYLNPNTVKVVVDQDDFALYFSRSPIPFLRDDKRGYQVALRHIGVYGYKKESLLRFVQSDQSYLEKAEKLEQLRALFLGQKIRVLRTNFQSVGIDTIDDLENARLVING